MITVPGRTTCTLSKPDDLHLDYEQLEMLGLRHWNYVSYVSERGRRWVVPWNDERLVEAHEQGLWELADA